MKNKNKESRLKNLNIPLFSSYDNTVKNIKLNNIKIRERKTKEPKNIFIINNNIINFQNPTINSVNLNNINTTFNTNEMDLIPQMNNFPKTCTNFFIDKNRLKIKNENDKINNNKNIINIINYSQISSIYNSSNYSHSIGRFTSKPKIKINQKKNNEFNSLEKYISKADKTIKEIKYEYQPNLKEFYINSSLKKYMLKSKVMTHAKNDLNELYKNSHMFNRICDYVSNALFKMKIKKRSTTKNIKKELNQMKLENLHKNMLKLKLKNLEIPQEKLYKYKKLAANNFILNPKIKAQLIYQSCYPSNSIKTYFDRYNQKRELNSIINNKTNFL